MSLHRVTDADHRPRQFRLKISAVAQAVRGSLQELNVESWATENYTSLPPEIYCHTRGLAGLHFLHLPQQNTELLAADLAVFITVPLCKWVRVAPAKHGRIAGLRETGSTFG